MFKCSMCGICCKNLNKNIIYKKLDRGDGVCVYYNGKKLICTIYEHRPLICRIDESYEKFFSSIMTREEYYNLNYKFCKELQEG